MQKEIKHYDNKLNENDEIIEKMKQKEITKKYIVLKEANDSKNKILEDLYISCNELNFQLNILSDKKTNLEIKQKKNEDENKILKDQINELERNIKQNEEEIKYYEKQKNDYTKKKKELDEQEKELKDIENENKKKRRRDHQ